MLQRRTEELSRSRALETQCVSEDVKRHLLSQVVNAAISERKRRLEHFSGDLFADPVWDMLLELFKAELGQYKLSVTSLCAAAGVPATTALRWLKAMEVEGLALRRVDSFDKRRNFVSLSQDASTSMTRYFGGQTSH